MNQLINNQFKYFFWFYLGTPNEYSLIHTHTSQIADPLTLIQLTALKKIAFHFT